MVLVDICSRFVILRALESKSAADTAEALWIIFCLFGFPKILQSDNGKEFCNSLVSNLLQLEGVTHRLITPYHPEANGTAERNVGLVKKLLMKLTKGNNKEWDSFLPAVQIGLNARKMVRHKSTPFALMFNRPFNLPNDFIGIQSETLSEDQLIKNSIDFRSTILPEIANNSNNYNEKMEDTFNKRKKNS